MQLHTKTGRAFSGMRIGLLGGSFNPAHGGHLVMSLYALKRLRLHQIWWLVSPQNPLKPVEGMASLEKRIKDAQAIVRHPRILVSDIEKQLGTRYSVDTLKNLRRRFPNTHFVWLMGADNLRQVPQWRRWTKIFNLVPVAVFKRPSHAIGYGLGKAAQRFRHNAKHPSAAGRLVRQKPPAWMMLDNPLNYISATEIRTKETKRGKK